MKFPRRIYHYLKSTKIKNKDITLICNNCFGAQILHDMGMRFNSPCVNLAFDFEDYVDFLTDLPRYISLDIKEVKDKYSKYPIWRFYGTDTQVKFMHYNSFEEGYKKWMDRRCRIKWDHIYVLAELNEMPEQITLDRFISLPYKKAIVTKPGSKIKEIYSDIIHEVPYFNDFTWGKALKWSSSFSLKKNTDYFDYVSFFNS